MNKAHFGLPEQVVFCKRCAISNQRPSSTVEFKHTREEKRGSAVPTMAVWSAMLEGRSYPDGATGLHALACLVAAHASHAAGGREVRLDDPSLPRDRQFKWA